MSTLQKTLFFFFCLDAHFLWIKESYHIKLKKHVCSRNGCKFIPAVHLHLLRGQSEPVRGNKQQYLTANKSA